MAEYRIITFDGGGVRGALTAALLQRLDRAVPGLLAKTNLLAGTSTGSFIALGLAYGLRPEALTKIYSEENAAFIFKPREFNIINPRYSNNNLKQLLESIFPSSQTLNDLPKKVVIPSFRLQGPSNGSWSPVFFNNFPNSEYLTKKIIDVALSSSAAPTYFPSYDKHIDGGVVANNPSTAALALAVDKQAGNQNLEDIQLLSLGTGFNPYWIKADTRKWGLLEWALYPSPPVPILSVLMDGTSEADDYFSAQFLGDRYLRINPLLNTTVSLDDYTKIPELIRLAGEFDLAPAIQWLNKYW